MSDCFVVIGDGSGGTVTLTREQVVALRRADDDERRDLLTLWRCESDLRR